MSKNDSPQYPIYDDIYQELIPGGELEDTPITPNKEKNPEPISRSQWEMQEQRERYKDMR